jgi:OmpA-OmpF porin, OOP family
MKKTIAAKLATAIATSLMTASAFAADSPVQNVNVRAVAFFDFNKATIRPDDRAKILARVGRMKDVTWQTVTATGHTDSVGAVSYNQRLSNRRAQAVKSYLVGKGLDPAMITTVAKAAAAPVASNDVPSGRAKNRRAEIEFRGVRATQ